MQPAALPSYLPFVLAPLFLFAIYRRLRTHFGRQPWRPRYAMVRLLLMSVLLLLVLFAAFTRPQDSWMLAVGAAIGAALRVLSLRLMHIEMVGTQPTYIPNPWLGALLSVLLLGRIGWRYINRDLGAGAAAPSALTLAFATTVLVFYLVQGAGLALRMRRLTAAVPAT